MANTGIRAGQGRLSSFIGNAVTWWVILILIPLSAATLVYLHHSSNFVGVDFDVYRGGAITILAGDPLYEFISASQLPFTYPPAAALAFVPLGLFPAAVAASGWTLLSASAMEALIWLVIRQIGETDPTARLRWTAVAGMTMLPLGPVGFNLWVGQINTFCCFWYWPICSREPGGFGAPPSVSPLGSN